MWANVIGMHMPGLWQLPQALWFTRVVKETLAASRFDHEAILPIADDKEGSRRDLV